MLFSVTMFRLSFFLLLWAGIAYAQGKYLTDGTFHARSKIDFHITFKSFYQTRVTNMRMNVLYITLLGSDAQESRGSFCKNYVIKRIKRQSFRAYTENITPDVLF